MAIRTILFQDFGDLNPMVLQSPRSQKEISAIAQSRKFELGNTPHVVAQHDERAEDYPSERDPSRTCSGHHAIPFEI